MSVGSRGGLAAHITPGSFSVREHAYTLVSCVQLLPPRDLPGHPHRNIACSETLSPQTYVLLTVKCLCWTGGANVGTRFTLARKVVHDLEDKHT